jgi:Transmembrane protein 65
VFLTYLHFILSFLLLAPGQVVSDVSGVVFGGTLEHLLSSWKLIPAVSLSSAQRRLPIARNVAMLGAVCGVVMGCTIGALVGLSTTDVAQREREQRDQEIASILVKLLAAHSPDWKLYLPQGTLSSKELEYRLQQYQQQQRLSDGRFGRRPLRPLADDPVAQQCLSLSASKQELAPMPSEDGNSLYIPLGHWAVLQCRVEDQTEATQLARHLAIVLETLLPAKP